MQRLRFINKNAQHTQVTVAAVNDGQPLSYDEIYEVSNELADKLLVNEEDWRLLSPPARELAPADPVTETEDKNE